MPIFIFLFSLLISGCSGNTEDIEKTVISVFEEQGFDLYEVDRSSGLFEHRTEAYKIYTLDSDHLYLVFNDPDHKDIIQSAVAETEFVYPVVYESFEEYSLIFTPAKDEPDLNHRIEAIFTILLQKNHNS